LPSRSLNTVFTDRLRGLRADLSAQAEALRGTSGGRWAHYTDDGGPAQDHGSVHEHFDRSELGKLYKEQLTSVGESAEFRLNAVTLQHDWLAAMERDYRLRHRPRLRCLAHGAALRKGLGADGGVLDTCVEKVVSNILSYEEAMEDAAGATE